MLPQASEFLQTTYITLANGRVMPQTSPHPIFEQLKSACQDGSVTEVQTLLSLVTPLPAELPGQVLVALQDCLKLGVESKRYDLVRAMLENGFLPYKLSCRGVDAAFHAQDTEMLKTFMDCGWNVNEAGPDMIMRPLLRHAVNKTTLRSFLLYHGACPNVANERGLTSLETAVGWSPIEVVEELLDFGGDPTQDDSLITAVMAGRLDVAELLIRRGADVNKIEKELPLPWGRRERLTALEKAKRMKQLDMVQWLEAIGAK